MELKYFREHCRCISRDSFNRTILELKWRRHKQLQQPGKLLIEPYWNWNYCSAGVRWTFDSLLIEPYWNWNISAVSRTATIDYLLIEPYWNWNINMNIRCDGLFDLLIEPYWNWNLPVTSPDSVIVWSFNRTILELKFEGWSLLCGFITTFNRTILELKYLSWSFLRSPL